MWLTILLLIFPVGFYLFYRNRKEQQRLFKNLGIPGPDPHWFFGSYEINKTKDMYQHYQDWTKIYGKTFGYYEGPTPVLVTTDIDIIKEVFIKHFDSFNARKPMPQPLPAKDDDNFSNMFTTCGSRWKRLRTIVNPTFSSSKMKQMFPIIQESISLLIQNLEKKAEEGKMFDIYSVFQTLTLDVIAKCAFGIDTECQIREGHPFLKTMEELFEMVGNPPAFLEIVAVLPSLNVPMWNLLMMLKGAFKDPYLKVGEHAREVIQQRRNSGEVKNDLLQHMLNASSDDHIDDGNISTWASTVGSTKTTVNKKLSEDEVIWQSALFLVVGYESTSTALAYCGYELALNPDVQTKLQAEIEEHVPEGEHPSYEMIHNMKYLDKVFCEILRMHPLGSQAVNRECMQQVTIKNIPIPVGMMVQVDNWSLHFDSEIWGPTDPNKFDPERFSPELKAKRDPITWMPFGVGPRNCIGMRFAIMEVKLALCRLLQKFTIQSCEDTEVPLVLKDQGPISPANGVKVKLIKKN